MNRLTGRMLRLSIAAVAGIGCLFAIENISLRSPGSLVTEAHAVIGHPATPMSYAGVARRTTRREEGGVGYGAVGAAAVGAAAVGAARCAQVTNAYGRIITQC